MSGRRMIHDDICEDRKLNTVSEGAEILFYRLLSKTDDFGRFYGDPALLKGQVFPRRHDLTVQVIASRLVELVEVELILVFKAEDGELIVQFKNFEKRQAFRKDIKRRGRFPQPGSQVTPTSSKKLVSEMFGPVTDPLRIRYESGTDTERTRTDSGLKTSKVKETKANISEGGGGGSNVIETETNGPVTDTSRELTPSSSSSFLEKEEEENSTHQDELIPKALGEDTERAVQFIVGIYQERFPNSRVPARSARSQVERAFGCKLNAQDIYEAIERTAARSTTRAEKIWEIIDPLIASRSSAADEEVEAGGLSLRDLQDIALRATGGEAEGGAK